MRLVFSFFCFVLCFLFSCSPEMWKSTKVGIEKTAQKAVYAKYVLAGVEAVKDSFPDSRVVLHYDSLSRCYFGVGELSEVFVVPLSDNRYLLRRNIDWLALTQKVVNEGNKAIDAGEFAIRFFDKGKRTPRDTL